MDAFNIKQTQHLNPDPEGYNWTPFHRDVFAVFYTINPEFTDVVTPEALEYRHIIAGLLEHEHFGLIKKLTELHRPYSLHATNVFMARFGNESNTFQIDEKVTSDALHATATTLVTASKIISSLGLSWWLDQLDDEESMKLMLRISTSKSAIQLANSLKAPQLIKAAREVAHKQERTYLAEGNDLIHMPVSELIKMASPAIDPTFWKRYSESRIENYRATGKKMDEQGGFMVILDESSSMTDEKVVQAKGVILALNEVAKARKQSCRVITFAGNHTEIFDLGHPENLIKFTTRRHRGTSEIQKALDVAATLATEKDHVVLFGDETIYDYNDATWSAMRLHTPVTAAMPERSAHSSTNINQLADSTVYY